MPYLPYSIPYAAWENCFLSSGRIVPPRPTTIGAHFIVETLLALGGEALLSRAAGDRPGLGAKVPRHRPPAALRAGISPDTARGAARRSWACRS
jgi:hypothetical protein